jgi:hypothetical protein
VIRRALCVLCLTACGAQTARAPSAPPPAVPPQAEPEAPASAPEEAKVELPLGGRELFPRYRLVGFCGTPGAPALGKLRDHLPERAKEIEQLSKGYAAGRQVLPVFELIAVVVQGGAGADGKYRRRVADSVVDEYLGAARAAKALLLLNVQPGRSDFMTEVKSFEKYLHEPDVSVALDPEWAINDKQIPGQSYGQSTGAVVNEVAEYLSNIVQQNDLPEKALVFHQVNDYVFKDEASLKSYPGIVLVKSVDGLGPRMPKTITYNHLTRIKSPLVHPGFKLFFDEDTRAGATLMTPQQVLSLVPVPEYVMYE